MRNLAMFLLWVRTVFYLPCSTGIMFIDIILSAGSLDRYDFVGCNYVYRV